MISNRPSSCIARVLPWVLMVSAAAAREDDFGSLVTRGLAAMEAGGWEEGLALHAEAVRRFGGNDPLRSFGPQFGAIHYRKGVCEMKLGRWDEAMRSFETCYRDFPNAGRADGGNVFEKLALLKWAESAMGAGRWQQAIDLFEKFQRERDKERDPFAQGLFHISLAICHYKLGRIPEGSGHLEIAIRNRTPFATPEGGIVSGFEALVAAVLSHREEQALLDFIRSNRGGLALRPLEVRRFAPVFMRIAGELLGAGMERAAMAIPPLVPSTDSAIDEIRARLRSMGEQGSAADGPRVLSRAALEQDLASLENERREGRTHESVALAATAVIHERNGNLRGALAAYRQLVAFHPASSHREEHLFHLARTASLVGRAKEAKQAAITLGQAFPHSGRLAATQDLALAALFREGDYEGCLELGLPLADTPGAEEPADEFRLHALGAACFHTGRHEQAAPLLDRHAERHPRGAHAMANAYFRAANTTRLGDWTRAAERLDAFLSAHPDADANPYLPFALYDRATCQIAQKQPREAVDTLTRLIDRFPNAPITAQARTLRMEISTQAAK